MKNRKIGLKGEINYELPQNFEPSWILKKK